MRAAATFSQIPRRFFPVCFHSRECSHTRLFDIVPHFSTSAGGMKKFRHALKMVQKRGML
jgi:hypothetical protein